MPAKDLLHGAIEKRANLLADLSDRIWGFAETRFEEQQSADALCHTLEAEGFTVQRTAGAVPHAFTATFGDGKPVIGFLGEYDALSGLSQKAGQAVRDPLHPGANGHGCGHHLLGVGALAAAVAMKEMVTTNHLSATIRYYGCPGEEGGSGKAFMARAGLFDDLDAAISWHPGTTNTVLTGSSLANIQVYYRFTGRASHAAGSPHLGRSALDAVELMNVGVNYLREHIISEARVHYALINTGGKSPNVVQPEAEVLYLIRAPKNAQVQEIYQRVCEIARGAAMMTQTPVTIQIDKACSNLVPNETMEKIMQANLEAITPLEPTDSERLFAHEIRASLSGAELESELKSLVETYGEREGRRLAKLFEGQELSNVVLPHKSSEKPMMGSTDVADVSWIVPTVQCWTSCYALDTPGHSWQEVAQGKETWAHKGMLLAAKAMAGSALDLMLHPEKLDEAKAELSERLAGESYRCPIPDGVQPSPVK